MPLVYLFSFIFQITRPSLFSRGTRSLLAINEKLLLRRQEGLWGHVEAVKSTGSVQDENKLEMWLLE